MRFWKWLATRLFVPIEQREPSWPDHVGLEIGTAVEFTTGGDDSWTPGVVVAWKWQNYDRRTIVTYSVQSRHEDTLTEFEWAVPAELVRRPT